jgi:hypothetical protein
MVYVARELSTTEKRRQDHTCLFRRANYRCVFTGAKDCSSKGFGGKKHRVHVSARHTASEITKQESAAANWKSRGCGMSQTPAPAALCADLVILVILLSSYLRCPCKFRSLFCLSVYLQGESTQSFKDAVSPIAQQCLPGVEATDGKRTINRPIDNVIRLTLSNPVITICPACFNNQ